MHDYSKPVKHSLRHLAATAHEREVRSHLEQLAESFARWQRGELNTWELTDLIHRFHDGPSRQLFNFYTGNNPDLAVVSALEQGILDEAEVPPEVTAAIRHLIAFSQWKRNVAD